MAKTAVDGVRERERQTALRALPLEIAELQAMFEALDVELEAMVAFTVGA